MPTRERILLAGAPGSGKTYSWLTIAEALPKSTFWVIDPEDGVERNRLDFFPDVKNIKYYFTPYWTKELSKIGLDRWEGGVMEAFKEIKEKVKENDWVIVEALGALWDMAQGGFVDQVFDKGIGEYFLEARLEFQKLAKSGKGTRLNALEGFKDWVVIKKMHNDDLIVPICYQLHVHSIFTSSLSITQRGEASKEDADIQSFYGDSLIRVDGEKRNPFRVQTIIACRGTPKKGFMLNTMFKERGKRKWLEDAKNVNFFYQYLVSVAGWSVPE